jgi:hypothetical protein
MKKLLLLLAAMITLTAQSQTSAYHPFPTGNADWVYRYYDSFHNPTPNFTSYSFNGDTIISSTIYKKVFTNASYSGAIRESAKVIYFVPDTSSTEYLLYNFNLDLGDTIIRPFGGAACVNDTVIVTQVDSVLTSDGYHRQLWFNSFAYWIEGIGAGYYFLNPFNVLCLSGNDILQCIVTDSGFAYPTGISSCIVTVSEHAGHDREVFISPNPASTELTIHCPGLNQLSQGILRDATGRIIMNFTFSDKVTLSLAEIAGGIYFLEVTGGTENSISRKKVIISR